MTANRGTFEPCLTPIFGDHEPVQHGIARLVAAQAAHATDLPRLAGATDEEAVTTKTKETGRGIWLRDAQEFARSCATLGVPFEELEPLIESACARAHIELSFDERQSLFECWFGAIEEKAA